MNAPANLKNQLTGSVHDSAGNLWNNGTYVYDAENRMTATAGKTYVYDGDGERVVKCTGTYPTCSGGTLYWGGASTDALAESSVTGTMSAEYFFYLGKRMARRDLPSGTVHYYLGDHLGSARAVTDATGALTEQSDYSPYGGEIWTSGSDPNHYKFTGKERDAESGLDMFGARYYGSSLGRFMTPDWSAKQEPVPYSKLDNPQTLNLYSYVQNNPLSNVDDDGHATIELRYTPVAVGNHTYIVVTDTHGHQTYYRAGPTNGASSGWITPASSGSSTQGAGSNSSNSSNSTTPGAGPGGAGANTGPFGALTANHGDYVPGTVDYETHSAASVTLLSNDQPASGYTDQLNQYENNINQSNIPYNPLSTNSNAYAEGAANFLGLTPPASPPVLAPGHSTPLPVPPPASPPPPPPPPCSVAGACSR